MCTDAEPITCGLAEGSAKGNGPMLSHTVRTSHAFPSNLVPSFPDSYSMSGDIALTPVVENGAIADLSSDSTARLIPVASTSFESGAQNRVLQPQTSLTSPSVVLSHPDDEGEEEAGCSGDDDGSGGSISMESMKRNMELFGSMFDVGSSHDILEELIGKQTQDLAATIDPAVDLVPHPPDGGYGWVIVACAFMCNLIFDGCMYGFGVMMPALQAKYGVGNAATAFAGALCASVLSLEGPIVSGLVNTFGCRAVSTCGALIGASAVLLSAYAPSLPLFVASYSVIGGVGFGMVFMPVYIHVGTYFERRRALATGISVAGCGAGTFAMAPLFAYLLEHHSLRITLLTQAALMVGSVAFTMMLKPLPTPPKAVELQHKLMETEHRVKNALSLIDIDDEERISIAPRTHADTSKSRTGSQLSIARSLFMKSRTGSMNRLEWQKLSRLRNVLSGSQVMTANQSDSTSALNNKVDGETDRSSPTHTNDPTSVSRQISTTDDRYANAGAYSRQTSSHEPSNLLRHRRPSLLHLQTTRDGTRISAAQYGQSISRMASAVNGVQTAQSILTLANVDPVEFSRPMARQDVLLSQLSIAHLPEFKATHNDMNAYRQQQISVMGGGLGGDDDVDLAAEGEEERQMSSFLPLSMRRIMAEMFDFSLLTHTGILVICIAQVFAFLGFYIPFVFIAARAQVNGVAAADAAFLLSYIGIANTIGRVFAGWLADRRWTTALNISNISLLLCGLANFCLLFTKSYNSAIVYGMFFGFVIAAFLALTSVVLVEQVGLDKLTNAFGLVCVARGSALLFGSPLGGLIFDATNDYNIVFAMSGILFAISGGLGTALHVHQTVSGARAKKEAAIREQTADLLMDGGQRDVADSLAFVPQLAPLTEEEGGGGTMGRTDEGETGGQLTPLVEDEERSVPV